MELHQTAFVHQGNTHMVCSLLDRKILLKSTAIYVALVQHSYSYRIACYERSVPFSRRDRFWKCEMDKRDCRSSLSLSKKLQVILSANTNCVTRVSTVIRVVLYKYQNCGAEDKSRTRDHPAATWRPRIGQRWALRAAEGARHGRGINTGEPACAITGSDSRRSII